LDNRPAIMLAHGQNIYHSTATTNIAELIAAAAQRPGTRILNSGDPQPPTALQITQYPLGLVEHSVPVLLLPGEPPKPGVGDHPWLLAGSLVADLTAAERELGYRPITTYRDAATETVAWLRDHVAHTNWQQHLTHMASLKRFFDYEAEDTFLRLLAQ
jgi:nucleoside-diphosphate-sugar epimerase